MICYLITLLAKIGHVPKHNIITTTKTEYIREGLKILQAGLGGNLKITEFFCGLTMGLKWLENAMVQ